MWSNWFDMGSNVTTSQIFACPSLLVGHSTYQREGAYQRVAAWAFPINGTGLKTGRVLCLHIRVPAPGGALAVAPGGALDVINVFGLPVPGIHLSQWSAVLWKCDGAAAERFAQRPGGR
jgi:hypothetical protein